MKTITVLERIRKEKTKQFCELSTCLKKKVACTIWLPDEFGIQMIYEPLSFGFNTSMPGNPLCNHENCLATEKHVYKSRHAEQMAIINAAKKGTSISNCIATLSLSPCIKCAQDLIDVGIKRVEYLEEYKDKSGILLLKKFDVITEKI